MQPNKNGLVTSAPAQSRGDGKRFAGAREPNRRGVVDDVLLTMFALRRVSFFERSAMIRFVPENCFRLLFLIGLACLPMSIVTHPSVAVASKLDQVLSPEEFKDPQKVEVMRDLLSRAENPRGSTYWLYFGLANMGLSLVGLYSYLPSVVATVRAAK
jgi:hypothetical protein